MKIQLKSMLGTSQGRFSGGKMLQLTVSHTAKVDKVWGDFIALCFSILLK
jgi:hypothetical protein